MEFRTHSHRHGLELFQTDIKYTKLWQEVIEAIHAVTDDAIAEDFQNRFHGSKSISKSINGLLKDELVSRGWAPESPIFGESEFQDRRWRLDFAKDQISIEVGFNHAEAIAWNLTKPVLASELNHVNKAVQTSAGIVICATEDLKQVGGFDSAVGTYEKYVSYLRPLQNLLTVPLVLVGLEPPHQFKIRHEADGRRKVGHVERITSGSESASSL